MSKKKITIAPPKGLSKAFGAFTKWTPPEDLVRLSACYQGLWCGIDGISSVGHWSCAENADEVQNWSDALSWLAQWAAAAAREATPRTKEEIHAVRTVLMDYHERCGDGIAERMATLARLAVIEEEIARQSRCGDIGPVAA